MLLYEEAIACMKKTNQVGTFSFELAPELIDFRQNIICMKRTNQVDHLWSDIIFLGSLWICIELDDHSQATKETLLWSPTVQVNIITDCNIKDFGPN